MSEEHNVFRILMSIITILLPEKKQEIAKEKFSCKSFIHHEKGYKLKHGTPQNKPKLPQTSQNIRNHPLFCEIHLKPPTFLRKPSENTHYFLRFRWNQLKKSPVLPVRRDLVLMLKNASVPVNIVTVNN